MIAKITELVKTHHSELLLVLVIVLITAISFNLGRISAVNSLKSRISIQDANIINAAGGKAAAIANPAPSKSGEVVASKNSKSKLYHFTWCASASKIAPQNKITFVSEAAAIAAGYTLASNCSK